MKPTINPTKDRLKAMETARDYWMSKCKTLVCEIERLKEAHRKKCQRCDGFGYIENELEYGGTEGFKCEVCGGSGEECSNCDVLYGKLLMSKTSVSALTQIRDGLIGEHQRAEKAEAERDRAVEGLKALVKIYSKRHIMSTHDMQIWDSTRDLLATLEPSTEIERTLENTHDVVEPSTEEER